MRGAGRLITFSGVDNAGKSTQVRLLAEALRQRGRRVEVVWFRPGYSNTLDGARALVRRLSGRALPRAHDTQARARAFERAWVRDAWIALALLDTAARLGGLVRAWLLRGHDVICDRYSWDARLDLTLRFPARREAIERALDVVELGCPAPSVAFLLALDQEEADRRARAKNEPFPDSPEVSRARRAAYEAWRGSGTFVALDAALPAPDVHHAVLQRLGA